MTGRFPNAELLWHRQRAQSELPLEEITSRIGPEVRDQEIEALSGGLANDSFRIGKDRVLRIYRRDASALRLEASLLRQSWSSFRVPRILEEGGDFLLLEYIEHSPLSNCPSHGAAVGRALAEIHNRKFDQCGTIDDSLRVSNPWDDFPSMMANYVREQIVCSTLGNLPHRIESHIRAHVDDLNRACANTVLLHGDFKASNLHWSADGKLLVLDWEFAYAGPAMLDLGQLIRWGIPESFRQPFVSSYELEAGPLPRSWRQLAAIFDLVNLTGLLAKSAPRSTRQNDCVDRIETILNDKAIEWRR